MIKKYLLSLLMTLSFFTMTQAEDSTNKEVMALFSRQIEILTLISPAVERIDLARLLVVKNSVAIIYKDMQDNLATQKPLTTFQTLRLIQNLIIQYRFSQSFFGWSTPVSMTSIYSDSIAPYLSELKQLASKVENDFGFDDSPYTQITSNTFKQMQKLLKQLETLSLDPQLKSELRSLWPSIGEAIAIADQGDRPLAFEKAIPIIEKIRDLYPYIDQVSSSNTGFMTVLELQGLTEFYAEFAQID